MYPTSGKLLHSWGIVAAKLLEVDNSTKMSFSHQPKQWETMKLKVGNVKFRLNNALDNQLWTRKYLNELI
jgi:hypothetical protein